MQQAASVPDNTVFVLLGVVREFGTTRPVSTTPRQTDTENYISGRFG